MPASEDSFLTDLKEDQELHPLSPLPGDELLITRPSPSNTSLLRRPSPSNTSITGEGLLLPRGPASNTSLCITGSFFTVDTNEVICDPDPPSEEEERAIRDLSTLYEEVEREGLLHSHRRAPSETGSEYDTDLEEAPTKVAEYDSSGIDNYIKICHDMKMRPVSHFMRQTKNPSLSLRYQSLGCKKTVAITQALASNTFVESLDLSNNDVGDDGMVSVARMLTENYFITELNLEDNQIGRRGVAVLCEVMSEHSYVKHLNLAGNGLKDNCAVILSEMLKANYTLTSLVVKQNQFSCFGARAISDALLSNDSLTELDISWNKIRNKGSEALGKMLGTNMGLISLNVSFNGLDNLGAAAFIKAIKTNQQLLNLNLINTRFPGSQCKELGKALLGNTSMRIVKLGNNPFKEADIDVLFNGLTSTALYIIGLEDIPMSKGLYGRLKEYEKEHSVVIHYGNSGGNQRTRPMTSSALRLDEFITTNLSKLAPLCLARDTDKSGVLTIPEFKECLVEAGLRIRQNELNRLIDKLNVDNHIPCKDILGGRTPAVLQNLRNKKTRDVISD